MSRELSRTEWNRLCDDLRGVDGEFSAEATIRSNYGSVEFTDDESGVHSDTTVYPHRDATDIRCGRVQLLVGRNRGALVVSHPPFPISRWTVLWEGEFFS